MDFNDFQIWVSEYGAISAVPRHPMYQNWQIASKAISEHYTGDIPEALNRVFPNEDETIKEYRTVHAFEPVTQSILIQAVDDICRLLFDSKFSVNIENKDFENWINDFKFDDFTINSFVFNPTLVRRVLDPNSILLIRPQEDRAIVDDRFQITPELDLISSSRIYYRQKDLILITPDEVNTKTIYYVVTDQFYGKIERVENGKIAIYVIYEHDLGFLPVVTLGGRPIVVKDEKSNKEHVVYKSDLLAAIPHLNKYIAADNQETSVALSTAFPFKFVKPIPCRECQGRGKITPDKPDPNNPDKLIKCAECKGTGNVIPQSPLYGYYINDNRGATKEERQAQAAQKPIEFAAPPVDIIRVIMERRDKEKKASEQILNIRRPANFQESGVAKEIDRESHYIQIGKISEDFFKRVYRKTLETLQALVFKDQVSKIVVNAPVSFDIKTETMLMSEFVKTLEGLPADVRYRAYLDFIKRRYSGDKISHRIAELAAKYAPLYLHTIDERESLIGSAGINRKEAIKAVFVFQTLQNIAETENILELSKDQIFTRIDKMIEPYFIRDTAELIDVVV